MDNQIAGVIKLHTWKGAFKIVIVIYLLFFFLGGGGGGRKGDRVGCIQLHFFTSLHFHLGN